MGRWEADPEPWRTNELHTPLDPTARCLRCAVVVGGGLNEFVDQLGAGSLSARSNSRREGGQPQLLGVTVQTLSAAQAQHFREFQHRATPCVGTRSPPPPADEVRDPIVVGPDNFVEQLPGRGIAHVP